MSRNLDLADFEYTGENPFGTEPGKIQLGAEGVRFDLPRMKKKKKYRALFDVEWSEIISFESCEVHYCQDEKSWPLDEESPEDYESLGTAGMLFIYLLPTEGGHFQIWGYFPTGDVPAVQSLVERYTARPSLPGLAHHGTAAAVRYMVKHSEIIRRKRAKWYDWVRKRAGTKPREKFGEKGPDFIYCKEGMAIDFYGAGEQLEQMSTFWPWRLVRDIILGEYEILYRWHEDSYTFHQQVWDEDERHDFYEAADEALETYHSCDDVDELLQIRPWSFPSRLHRSWDKLEPFASKASRNGFPPIYDFEEE